MEKRIENVDRIDKAMKKIARIHARISGNHADWIFHQTIRFLFDGYPQHAGPLFQRLQKLEGNSLRVRGLRLILKSEEIRPTPFAGLCPKRALARSYEN